MPSKSMNLICPNPKCKEEINKPILLTDLSKSPAESYYACPRCMIKLNVASEPQKVPDVIPITAKEIPEEEKASEVVEPQKVPDVIPITAKEIPEEEKASEVVEPQEPEEKPVKPPETKEETPSGCPHYFGYLSRRPKNASIPEECLTCQKMITCMLKL